MLNVECWMFDVPPFFWPSPPCRVVVKRRRIKRGGTVHSLQNGFLRELQIPVPPLAVQRALVAELESERLLVEANRELAARFEQKLQSKLSEIWGAPPTA
jgi:hypothetical protein